MFNDFSKYGLKPDVVTYRAIIKMHILGCDIQAAFDVKDKMIEEVCYIMYLIIYCIF